MIKVLIVDDSLVSRTYLAYILGQDPGITVVGHATDGESALRQAELLRPNVITMDLLMPGMDGIQATAHIMERVPTPIVIVSTTFSKGDVDKTFQAMTVGAVAIIEKPRAMGTPDGDRMVRETVATVKAMATVPVVRRKKRILEPLVTIQPPAVMAPAMSAIDVIGIGASTGGPPALQTILSQLPAGFPVPILIVQHIAAGFVEGMVEWLQHTCPLKVQLARSGDVPRAGSVYVAPDGNHLEYSRTGALLLSAGPADFGLRPSVARLFASLAANCSQKAVGVLLTGMGRDGADDLKKMRDRGCVTFAQDAESSVVHGMPGEAIRLGAAQYIMPPLEIAAALCRLTAR